MDIRFIALGAILLIVVVVMGNDPLEELRKQAARDPLQEDIEAHFQAEEARAAMGNMANIAAGQQGTPMGSAAYYNNGQAYGYGDSNLQSADNTYNNLPTNAQDQMVGTPTQNASPSTPTLPRATPGTAMILPDMSGRNPMQPQPDWFASQQLLMQQTQEEIAMNAPPPNIANPSSSPSFYLKDGTRIFFSGTKVYKLNKKGSLVSLKDGKYNLTNGQNFTVRDGKRLAN